MSELTGLEKQEQEIGALVLGKPEGLGAVDKSMLQISDTNRLVIDAEQSSSEIALKLLYAALTMHDRQYAEYERVKDPVTGDWRMKTKGGDNWAWLNDIIQDVRTNQLTIKGYSRAQHLRQQAQQVAVTADEEQRSFWDKLFSGFR